MWRLLCKTFKKDLATNKVMYLSIFLLIMVGMYLVGTFTSSTYSTETILLQNSMDQHQESGEFITRTESDDLFRSLTEAGFTVEKAFYYDVAQDESVFRIMKERKYINTLVFDDGRFPQNDNEIALDNVYTYLHEIKVGDTVKISNREYTVSGLCAIVDYDCPLRNFSDGSSDSSTFAIGFLTDTGYQELFSASQNVKETYVYSYYLENGKTEEEIHAFIKDHTPAENMLHYVPANFNGRLDSTVDDSAMYSIVGLIIGVGFILIVALVLILKLKDRVDKEQTVIGALYSMGCKKSDIIPMYLIAPFLVTALAGLVGYLISLTPIGAALLNDSNQTYYCIPYSQFTFSNYWWVLPYCVVLPPVLSVAINLIVLNKRLNLSAVALLRGQDETVTVKGSRKSSIRRLSYMWHTFTGEKAMILVLLICAFITGIMYNTGRISGVYALSLAESTKNDVTYEYYYQLNPVDFEVPANAEAAFVTHFATDFDEYTFTIDMIGLDTSKDYQYFDVDESKLKNRDVIISQQTQAKFLLEVGDTLTVYDSFTLQEYEFTVVGVTDYSPFFSVFVDGSYMKEQLGYEPQIFNALFSEEKLDIASDQVQNVYTKELYDHIAMGMYDLTIQTELTVEILAWVFFSIVILFLLLSMIEKSNKRIAIMKSLGFRLGEIVFTYVGGLALAVLAFSALGFFLGNLAMQYLKNFIYAGLTVASIAPYSVGTYLLNLVTCVGIFAVAVFIITRRIYNMRELDYLTARE